MSSAGKHIPSLTFHSRDVDFMASLPGRAVRWVPPYPTSIQTSLGAERLSRLKRFPVAV